MSRVVIEVRGANCAWCLSNLLLHLRSHQSVTAAEFRGGTGCIEIDHEAADFEGVLAQVSPDLRGWRQADNGERVMVDLEAHPTSVCPFRAPGGPRRYGRGRG